MHPDFESMMISKEEIAARVGEIAREIDRQYAGKNPLMVCVLKGSLFFFSDLLHAMEIPAEIDFISVSSYGAGDKSTGKITMKKDLSEPIEGRHVIIVEDIVDSGNTLSHLRDLFAERQPASFAICTLLDKPSRRVSDVKVDYCGFRIPDEFIVGYGLDYAERYRLENDIYVLKRSVYEK